VAKPALPDPKAAEAPAPPKPPAGGGGGTDPAQPGPSTPTAMAPTAAKKQGKVITKTKPTRRLQPGDLVCGSCGEGNPPARKFCSRCGESLSEAVVVKKKWWQRLVPKRKAKTLEVGERPGVGGVKAKKQRNLGSLVGPIRKVLVAFALVCGLLFTFVGPFRDWAQDNILDPISCRWDNIRTTRSVTIQPLSVTDALGPATEFSDTFKNTVYLRPAPAAGQPIVITVTFQSPVNIDNVNVFNGNGENIQATKRPATGHFTFDNGQSFSFTLNDNLDIQTINVTGGGQVRTVEVSLDTFNGQPQLTEVAVAEFEFQSKSKRDCSRRGLEREEVCPSNLIENPSTTVPEICRDDTVPTTVPPAPTP
jgi:hypothetical protein